ncbi:MAG: 16S rRNA (guanine(966)-N(2))-methyltransferase RsmD [Desulfobacterales bacterium]|nr:16S rRNA (guanine(966)-N(2))-methyltransferase RsmD [Desulfobacterales bacterium]
MRVIAGELKGRRLVSAKGRRVRPTSDRTKEAVFSILFGRIQGAMVLDLFSGTGALAIEAISRGAAAAVLIDAHGESLAVIRQNLKICGVAERTTTIKWKIEKDLVCIRDHEPPFDLVFMDPPYERGLISPTLENLAKSRCLAGGAWLVIEHAASDPLPEAISPFFVEDQRRYGKTLVSFLSHML